MKRDTEAVIFFTLLPVFALVFGIAMWIVFLLVP